MSLGGSSESQQQLDPALRDLFLQNYGSAQTTAGGLKARQFAGFTPEQNQALQNISQFADPNSEGFQALRGAYGVANTAANYRPQTATAERFGGADVDRAALAQAAQLGRGTIRDVNAERIAAAQAQRTGARDVSSVNVRGKQVAQEALSDIAPEARASIRDITAGSFLNQNLQQYMNPYTQAVTQQSLADLERSRLLQQQQTAAQATASRAFGGSRQGVAEAETNRAFGENAARLVAQQNAAGYEAAQRASESDLARQMQAQQLNQAQDLATTQQSLQLAGQFGLANQDAALRAALANQAVDVQYGLANAQLQQQASLANQDAMLKAALANQGYDFNVGQLNTQNQQQAALANQAAKNARSAQQASLFQQAGLSNADRALQASLANQGAGLTANQQRIGAANQMANTGTAFTNMGIASNQALADQGLLRQGFSQQQLDAIRNLPLEQQQIINQALGINVGGGSGMQQTSSSGQGLFGLFR